MINLLLIMAVMQGAKLPNIVPNSKMLADSSDFGPPFVSTETFTATSPDVLDLYITAGTHKLLRFAAARDNIGTADMVLGDPATSSFYEPQPSGGKRFKPGDRYHLWTQAGFKKWQRSRNLALPIAGTKNAIYLADAITRKELLAVTRKHMTCAETEYPININNPVPLVAPPSAPPWAFGIDGNWYGYSCAFQGFSVGWRDVYGHFMEGNYLDVTSVPSGTYILEFIVNPDHDWPMQESKYTDNSAQIQVTIP